MTSACNSCATTCDSGVWPLWPLHVPVVRLPVCDSCVTPLTPPCNSCAVYDSYVYAYAYYIRRVHFCYMEGSKVSHNSHTHESQAVTQLLHGGVKGVTQLSHTWVTSSRTTVTCRGHRGHTPESQAVAQLLHGEFTGVTQREENNIINIHHNVHRLKWSQKPAQQCNSLFTHAWCFAIISPRRPTT